MDEQKLSGYIKSRREIWKMPGWFIKSNSIYHSCGKYLDYSNNFFDEYMGTGILCEFSLEQIKGSKNDGDYRELWRILNDKWDREVYREMIIEINPFNLENELFEI